MDRPYKKTYLRGPSDIRIDHKGLMALANLNLVKVIKKIGEDDTIDLVSALISAKAYEDESFIIEYLTKYELI
jgi:hypothetical protein